MLPSTGWSPTVADRFPDPAPLPEQFSMTYGDGAQGAYNHDVEEIGSWNLISLNVGQTTLVLDSGLVGSVFGFLLSLVLSDAYGVIILDTIVPPSNITAFAEEEAITSEETPDDTPVLDIDTVEACCEIQDWLEETLGVN